jgi:hypothetical protein
MLIDFPLRANDEVLAATLIVGMRDRAFRISSVIPSEKYSLSASALMLANGRTPMDGISDSRTRPVPVVANGPERYRNGSPLGGVNVRPEAAESAGAFSVAPLGESARTRSSAAGYRSAGSRASDRITTVSSHIGMSLRTSEGRVGASVNRLTKPSLPANGGRPVSISYNTQPRL